MVEFFNWLVTLFLNTPVEVLVLVLGAAGVSVLSQLLKKWFKIENERWMFLTVVTIAGLGSFLDWFINSSTLPVSIIGIQTSVLVGIAQPIYFYAVKPLNLIIAGYRQDKKAIQEKLQLVEAAPAPAVVNTLDDAQKVLSPAQTVATAPVAAPSEETIDFVETEQARPFATF